MKNKPCLNSDDMLVLMMKDFIEKKDRPFELIPTIIILVVGTLVVLTLIYIIPYLVFKFL